MIVQYLLRCTITYTLLGSTDVIDRLKSNLVKPPFVILYHTFQPLKEPYNYHHKPRLSIRLVPGCFHLFQYSMYWCWLPESASVTNAISTATSPWCVLGVCVARKIMCSCDGSRKTSTPPNINFVNVNQLKLTDSVRFSRNNSLNLNFQHLSTSIALSVSTVMYVNL